MDGGLYGHGIDGHGGGGQTVLIDVAVDATEMDGAERAARCPVARARDANVIIDLTRRCGFGHPAAPPRPKDRTQRVGKQ